ncbi:hypothetical protein QBC38DRAFT_402718 [Podospora fimiseda]|uniref:Ubiquitin-like domain-containing protein n=1 Tax=Podospora fimiseda TaxID=252190 RepID=A0AAN6YPK5_9PEZI|nr:hypothetical protein QBC38DRAFT_402718 [Podospora fimiseda]
MADPVGLAGSVVGIIAFGLKVGTTLQTYVELAQEVEDSLREIVFDVNATASALRQLQDIIEIDKLAAKDQNRSTIFTDAGLNEIQSLAWKCEKIYKTIIVLVHKASGDPMKAPTKDGINPDLLNKPLNIMNKLKWPWLEPRVARCHDQLRWLKVSLLLNLQIAHLAKLHLDNKGIDRPNRTLDQEVGFRIAAEGFRHRQVTIAKKITKKEAQAAKKKPCSVVSSKRSRPMSPTSSVNSVQSTRSTPAQSPASQPPEPSAPAPAISTMAAFITTDMGLLSLPQPPAKQVQTSGESAVAGEVSDGDAKIESASDNLAGMTPTSVDIPPPLADTVPAEKPQAMASKEDSENTNAPEQTTESDKIAEDQTPNREPDATAQVTKSSVKFKFPPFTILDYFRKPSNYNFASTDLEAWSISSDDLNSIPTKLPYTHQQLKVSLKRLQRKKHTTPGTGSWPPAIPMTPAQRVLIDKTITAARRSSPRIRTCIAVQAEPGCYIIYFSLGEPELPVYFKDAVGRKFKFPYELVKHWEDMKEMIEQAFRNMEVLERHVNDGRYDLTMGDEGLEIISSSVWDSTVSPGLRVTMHMWPMERFLRPFPPPGMGMMPPPPGGMGMMRPPPPVPPGMMRPGHLPPPVLGWMAGPRRETDLSPQIVDVEPPERRRRRDSKVTKYKTAGRSRASAQGGESRRDWYDTKLKMEAPRKFIYDFEASDSGSEEEEEEEEEEENKLAPEEEEELKAVDFDELIKDEEDDKDAVAEMLRRFTNVTDVDSSIFAGAGKKIWGEEGGDSGSESE